MSHPDQLKMEVITQPCFPPSASVALISAVIGDDDLLCEIIIRLAFPTCLLRAALVCKRWFRLVSCPALLRRFRKLHPPRLLGFYVNTKWSMTRTPRWNLMPIPPRFVPMADQPPELAMVVPHASFGVDNCMKKRMTYADITDCRNGSVFTRFYHGAEEYPCRVHTPLHPEKSMVAIPPPPSDSRYFEYDTYKTVYELFSKDVGVGLSYFWLAMDLNLSGKATTRIHKLQDGVWRIYSCVTTQLPHEPPTSTSTSNIVLLDEKVYMAATVSDLLVLDLTALSSFTIELPEGVKYGDGDIKLSPADDSGIYLINVKELQLHIWFHRGHNGTTGNWLLIHKICLRDISDILMLSSNSTVDNHTNSVKIAAVGDNAEFVFLQKGQSALHLDTKSRVMRKVYEVTEKDHCLAQIRPFMMIWPPTFPTAGN